MLTFVDHAIADARQGSHGQRRVISRRFEFVEIPRDAEPRRAGYAPYLDYRPVEEAEAERMKSIVAALGWPGAEVEHEAEEYAVDVLAAEHLAQVRVRTLGRLQKVREAVYTRLTDAARYHENRGLVLKEQAEAGKTPKMNPDQAFRIADELLRRRAERMNQLDREAQLAPQAPRVVGAALVVPIGLIHPKSIEGPVTNRPVSTEQVERRAVDAVLASEERLGRRTREMPHNNPGYDIRSTGKAADDIIFIEVKGRIEGADSFVVTQNELRFAANVPDTYLLAMVEVSTLGPAHDLVRYLRAPYGDGLRLPFDTTSTTLHWNRYWVRGTAPV